MVWSAFSGYLQQARPARNRSVRGFGRSRIKGNSWGGGGGEFRKGGGSMFYGGGGWSVYARGQVSATFGEQGW